jgi:hypothetical protein
VSDFVRALNSIKASRHVTWLTPSQGEALVALQRALRVPCSVNLFGPAGTGKTFLAWILTDEMGYAYFPHISYLEKIEVVPDTGIIVDNCGPERNVHRHTLRTLSFRNVRYSVLISRQSIRDYTHYVELGLTLEDQTHIWHNLMSIRLFRETDDVPNLWHLLNPHL